MTLAQHMPSQRENWTSNSEVQQRVLGVEPKPETVMAFASGVYARLDGTPKNDSADLSQDHVGHDIPDGWHG